MALVNTELITPAEASGLVLGAYQTTRSLLPFGSIMPDKNNATGINVSWVPNEPRTQADEMPFSAWDAEAAYDRTEDHALKSYTEMLPLRKRHRVGEYDIIAGRASESESGAETELRDAFSRLGVELAYTVERACVSVAVDGVLGVSQANMAPKWDYERDKALTVELKNKALWGDASADPVKDLKAWSQTVYDHEGARPHAMFTTRKVMDALMANIAIMKYHYQGAAQSDMLPPFIAEDLVRNVLSQYANITSVTIIDELYEDYARKQKIVLPGGVKSYFPENTVLLLPGLGDTGIGYTALGPTAEAKTSSYGIKREYNAGPVGVVQDIAASTPGYEAYANVTALPVLVQSNSTFKATVLSA